MYQKSEPTKWVDKGQTRLQWLWTATATKITNNYKLKTIILF